MGKARRVIVTLEMTTDESLSSLRGADIWDNQLAGTSCNRSPWCGSKVHQVQVNVIKPERARKKART